MVITIKSVYIAGFDVFTENAYKILECHKKICSEHGLRGLSPLDHEISGGDPHVTANKIRLANQSLIDQCDFIAANMNPFRGSEPDSGTCFEIGYGIAKGKIIFCYLDNTAPMIHKIPRAENRVGFCDSNGYSVENFDLPLNLMIATASTVIQGDFEDCIREICRKYACASAGSAAAD